MSLGFIKDNRRTIAQGKEELALFTQVVNQILFHNFWRDIENTWLARIDDDPRPMGIWSAECFDPRKISLIRNLNRAAISSLRAVALPIFRATMQHDITGVKEMGLFHVKARLTGPTGHVEEVELLVDTGATLSVVPRALAERLELKPARSQSVVIAGGRREVWPIAEARLALNGAEITTPCFIAPDGPPLLGAVTLESLFLAVDPVGKRLIPVDGFVG